MMWTYLPHHWCGQATIDLYRGAITSTLCQTHGVKNKYLLLEDNDTTGYNDDPPRGSRPECPGGGFLLGFLMGIRIP